MTSTTALNVSVVIPTIGRPDLLNSAIRSILACDPGPAEVIVVDQSEGFATRDVIVRCGDSRVRRIVSDGRGAALARNTGLRAAMHQVVMFTDDDCRVRSDWVCAGFRHVMAGSRMIVTGQVRPGEGSFGEVPSTITSDEPFEWTGILSRGALYSGNMAGERDALGAVGPFDERPSLRYAAEDNELCFRWIRSGARLLYAPDMVVWHEDWRGRNDMAALRSRYARGQGAFYAKHLIRGDKVIARYLVEDLLHGSSRWASAVLRRSEADECNMSAEVGWMLVGFLHGVYDSVAGALRRGRSTADPREG